MNIVDISWPISPEMTGYRDSQVCEFLPLFTFEKNGVRTTKITLMSHTGTHVDAPSHFIADGGPIDSISLQLLCGACIVLDAMQCEVIDVPFLEQITDTASLAGIIVLFKTKNSRHTSTDLFDYEFTQVSAEAAVWLVQSKIKAIGIDYLGLEIGQTDHPVHLSFLGQDIPIIEGLRLGHVYPDRYTLICLPLPIVGLDGAPARAVLLPPQK